uniref:G_PROTEIN_RECEP_F2_4 domain-containing protein n=1 Tax=Heterorhabditis bacteriophora TaxID=37862 RepID=A0A1I7XCD4_HETBA
MNTSLLKLISCIVHFSLVWTSYGFLVGNGWSNICCSSNCYEVLVLGTSKCGAYEGFPVDWAVQWTKNHITSVWVVALLYVFVTLSASGRVIIKHKLLPHWYWMNGIFQSCLLIAFLPEVLMILSNGWKESVCRTGSLYSGQIFVSNMILALLKCLQLQVRYFICFELYVILESDYEINISDAQIFQFIICLAVCLTAQNVLEKSGRCDIDADRLYLDKIFRETHKYAWTVLRSERCIKSRQSSRRSEDLRPTQKIYTGWSPTGITPTDPNITN